MKQTSSLTRHLTESQERAAKQLRSNDALLWRLYTEDCGNLTDLTSRYFDGATVLKAVGLWKGNTEHSAVIEILGTWADLQRIVFLVGDIKTVNNQSAVLVTYEPVSQLEV